MNVVADFDLAGFGDGGPTFDPIDLVLLEQEFDPFGVAVDHALFVIEHRCPIDLGFCDFEAHFAKVLFGFVQRVRRVQKGLGRDAAYVQAGAAEGVTTFDNCGLQTQLGATDCADIATRAGADYDNVIAGHSSLLFSSHLCGKRSQKRMADAIIAIVARNPTIQIRLRHGRQPK